jgi:hypothetical protein
MRCNVLMMWRWCIVMSMWCDVTRMWYALRMWWWCIVMAMWCDVRIWCDEDIMWCYEDMMLTEFTWLLYNAAPEKNRDWFAYYKHLTLGGNCIYGNVTQKLRNCRQRPQLSFRSVSRYHTYKTLQFTRRRIASTADTDQLAWRGRKVLDSPLLREGGKGKKTHWGAVSLFSTLLVLFKFCPPLVKKKKDTCHTESWRLLIQVHLALIWNGATPPDPANWRGGRVITELSLWPNWLLHQ